MADNRRVVLFSKPQQMLAANASNPPEEKEIEEKSSVVNNMQAAVINRIAVPNLFPTVSLNHKNAIIAVAAISKLLSNETVAGVVLSRPHNSSMGAAVSKSTIAQRSGTSRLVSEGETVTAFILNGANFIISIPNPAPRYKRAAKKEGERCRNNNLEKGTLNP